MVDNTKGFKLSDCKVGLDFENWVSALLTQYGFDTKRTSKNDNGVDIIATRKFNGTELKFYIQCKYHNRVLGKTPIQEIYTGHHYFGADGYPVLITNNRVTAEAKVYAKKMGVEIISELDLNELQLYSKTRHVINTSHTGLMGILVSILCNDTKYYNNVMRRFRNKLEKPILTDKDKLKLELINTFDQADILMQDAAEMQQRALNSQRQALALQKEALLKNLDYG